MGKESRKIWFLCLHAIIWGFWKERNRRVFDNLSVDPSSVWKSLLFLVTSCAKKDITLSSFSFESFVVI